MGEEGDETDPLLENARREDQPAVNETEENRRREPRKLCLGIVFAAASVVLCTTNNFMIKSFHVIVSDVLLVRCFLQITILTSYILFRGESLFPGSRRSKILTLLQGISGAICLIACLASVKIISVVEALAIICFSPVVTMVLAVLMLGEHLNTAKIFSGVVLLLGELLVCQPAFLFPSDSSTGQEDGTYRLLGVGLAITACVSGSFSYIFVNMMKSEPVSATVLVNWVAISVVFLAISYSLIVGDSRILSPLISSISWTDWMILICLGLSGILGFLCVTLSLQLISAVLVSSIRSFELVLASLVTSVLLQQAPSVLTSLGVVLVTVGVLVLTFQEDISKIVKTSWGKIRDYFKSCCSDYETIP